MNKKTLKIAEELIKIANILLFAKPFPFPEKSSYHNNKTNIDAHISNTEQRKINHSCRETAKKYGITDEVFDEVLKNIRPLFLNSTPETDLIQGEKENDAFDKRYYQNSISIDNHNYYIRFMVKFPKQDPKRKQPNAKIKLYTVEVHKQPLS